MPVPIGLIGTTTATALTMEQAIARCKESVGRPLVRSCMMGSGGALKGGGEARERCIAQATPQVRACVAKALNAANGRPNVAVPLPAESKPGAMAKNVQAAQTDAAPALFVAPQRTIADITAILDSEKPDPKRIEELQAKSNAKAPSGGSAEQLGRFYYERASARAQLGRLSEAVADSDRAVEHARRMADRNLQGRVREAAVRQNQAAGNLKAAIALNEATLRDATDQNSKGYQFGANSRLSAIYLQLGNVVQAETQLRRNLALVQEARTSGLPAWREFYKLYGQWIEGTVENNRGVVLEGRGQLRQAEEAYRASELRGRAGIPGVLRYRNSPRESELLSAVGVRVLAQARVKAKQGRLAEAEVDARRALLSQLKAVGKYDSATPRFVMVLAGVLAEQGRLDEAEKLIRTTLEIIDTIGVVEDSQTRANVLSNLGRMLNLARRTAEANEVYDRLDRVTAKWEPRQRETLLLNNDRIYAFFASGRLDAGIAAAESLLKREIARVGEKHFDAAATRGVLAIGLARAGRDVEAVREFRAAIPIMLTALREAAVNEDDSGIVDLRNERFRDVVEAYIGVRARGGAGAGDVAFETFRLADAIRGQAVQAAFSASAARMVASETGLAELVRREQDLEKQVGAHLGLLNNALSLPSSQREDGLVPRLNAEIERLRASRYAARADIAKRFPNYAELIEPKSPSVDEMRTVLRHGETYISFYFGRERSFVWALPKDGPVAFRVIEATGAELERKIATLRKALEPDVDSIAKIPAFDVALASELYGLLLKPVEASWKHGKSLIVTTNGALGLLPLGLLPTARAEVKVEAEPWFSAYRDVPWLARTHAVTLVPSAASLKTLRQLPAGSSSRETLIGFGDPFFSEVQAAEAQREAETMQVASADAGAILFRRASPMTDKIDSADLARLPRLPDTADELKAIAEALRAEPARALHLGKAANEQAVKRADLSRFRIVAFATHGLLPGDLNGLTQPALALTAPNVAGIEGDGLLTMEEILALKLDADWVILSACNTGAGSSSGAEALSGLGRAFFYAGTRSLLITNWSVDSVSARELVTDLFKRQAADASLPRAEALRLAMTALIDTGGYSEGGRMLYSYAHPLFWAPYSIIGEGGGHN
jgi:CHAT domain-containing protein